ncbi:MAG: helix-turn-helix transcriptional regulator [Archangiaceae bacterium]|nr:helix-turn-helix transcriptional regulator [Archangiaceae bacterium]
MSRSVFAARFTRLVGEPPMQHVARVQMQAASTALKEQRASVGELAERFGYQSQAAFSRAFKRIIGVPPVAMKRSLSPLGGEGAS